MVTTKRIGDSRPGGRTARTRSLVLGAAVELLAEIGYEQFSIELVAERAGVHKTTVYRRWPTKVDLIADATRERSRNDVPVPDTGTLAGDLRALARSVAANLRSPAVHRMTSNIITASSASPDLANGTSEFWAERLTLMRVIVERANARGEITGSPDPNLIIEAVVGALYLRLLFTGEPIDNGTADAIADLVADGATRIEESTQPELHRFEPSRRHTPADTHPASEQLT